jgi:hypothetical protein
MSQNMLETESCAGRVRVRSGWDAPTGELFCNVEQLQPLEDVELPGCFYTTSYASVEEISASLTEARIRLPSAMLQAITEDMAVRAGNVIRVFSESGELLDLRRV